jgi:hypothetical protein
MDLTQDFKEFVQSLNRNNVHYLVVGGYAVTAHGFPRYTGDIDFWIHSTQDNATSVVNALHDFGFGSVDITVEDLMQKDNVIQLGFPPHRIDLLTAVTGVEFEECWNEKVEIEIDGEMVHFISLRHLKINKLATGRTQDKLDLENLP